MKKTVFFVVVFFFSLIAWAQEEDAWIYFADKPNAQAFLDNPLTDLSQRALDRRNQQNIAVTIQDAPIHQPYIDQVAAQSGITVMAKSKWLNCIHVRGSQTAVNALGNLSFVASIVFADASLNSGSGKIASKVYKAVNKQMETATSFDYGNSLNQIQMLNGHILHQQNYTGTGKIIAVLDSGFINVNSTSPFQRLFDNNLILDTYNYVNRSSNVYDLHNHGTMTLSCIGGYVDGQLVGTAPDASFLLFVTEDVTSENPVEESYWVEAAEEADRQGADVISTSLGYFGYDNPAYSHQYEDMTGDSAFASKGANIAFSKGMIVVASAGNAGSTSEPHVGVPAEATHVVAVGAVMANENYAAFSSIGPSFDGRVKPDLMAQGQSAYLATTAGTVQTASGTSFSCPILAGAITCFWQAFPNLSNQEVVTILKQSADRFANPTVQYGYGIPDFQEAMTRALLGTTSFVTATAVVYPNPAQTNIQILLPEGINKSDMQIYNALGQKVLECNLSGVLNTINIEQFANGFYSYSLTVGEKQESGRLIIQK